MAWRMALLGAVAAAVFAAGIHLPFPAQSQLVLGLSLVFCASVYLGALLAGPQGRPVQAAELAVGAAVFGCAVLGLAVSPVWLAVGYAAHGGWDWLHHARVVPSAVARWFPPACAGFDLVVAVFVLGWLWPSP